MKTITKNLDSEISAEILKMNPIEISILHSKLHEKIENGYKVLKNWHEFVHEVLSCRCQRRLFQPASENASAVMYSANRRGITIDDCPIG